MMVRARADSQAGTVTATWRLPHLRYTSGLSFAVRWVSTEWVPDDSQPVPLHRAEPDADAVAPAQTSAPAALDALAEIAQDLSRATTKQDLQAIVSRAARRLTGADGATLVLREGDECVYADEDAVGPLWKGRRFPLDDCISGWSMRHAAAAAVEDVAADDRIAHDAYSSTFVRSLLMVPIVADEPLGAIGLYWARRHLATTEETALARALAASTGVALERVRIAEQLERSAQENRRLTAEVERRRSVEEDLRELSERDGLTGLLNRRAWDMALTGSLRKRRRPLYVALMDVDRFKDYNDVHGHPAGDALLRQAAREWRGALRTADVLARYGGEEFAILLAGCSAESALEIVERVREATVGDQTVSIGLATWDGREPGDALVCRADRALYDAKRAGRNRVVAAP
jgi:diguanylate cyclase (GGDEF)-like protein